MMTAERKAERKKETRKYKEEAKENCRLGLIEYTPKEKSSYNKFFHYKIAFYTLVLFFVYFIIRCIHTHEFHMIFTILFFVFCLIAFGLCYGAFKM